MICLVCGVWWKVGCLSEKAEWESYWIDSRGLESTLHSWNEGIDSFLGSTPSPRRQRARTVVSPVAVWLSVPAAAAVCPNPFLIYSSRGAKTLNNLYHNSIAEVGWFSAGSGRSHGDPGDRDGWWRFNPETLFRLNNSVQGFYYLFALLLFMLFCCFVALLSSEWHLVDLSWSPLSSFSVFMIVTRYRR